VTGGILLLVSVAFGFAARGPLIPLGTVRDVLLVVGAIVFVVGLGRGGSITRRRIVGSTATVLLVVAPMTQAFWYGFVPDKNLDPHLAEDVSVYIMAAYFAVVLAVGVTSVVSIVRAEVVPSPWCWAPSWVLMWVPLSFVLGLVLAPASMVTASPSFGSVLLVYGPSLGVAFLGGLGVVLGLRATSPARTTNAVPAE
jgi:hypothetical protein